MLEGFAGEALDRVRDGYYDVRRLPEFCPPRAPPPLRAALERPGPFPLIAEVKPASPTRGEMREVPDAGALARSFADAGARGVSALVPRERFGGSCENVIAATTSGAPVLFKDFVVHDDQVRCARRCGASAVLLILDLHERGLAHASVESFVRRIHDFSMQALLEVYDRAGYERALATDADLIGINNRDLRAGGLPVDLDRTRRVLDGARKDRPVIALSGCETGEDVARMRDAGADGVLVGSALMSAADPAGKLRSMLVPAGRAA